MAERDRDARCARRSPAVCTSSVGESSGHLDGSRDQIVDRHLVVSGEREPHPTPPGRRPVIGNVASRKTPETTDRRGIAVRVPARGDGLADRGGEIRLALQQRPARRRRLRPQHHHRGARARRRPVPVAPPAPADRGRPSRRRLLGSAHRSSPSTGRRSIATDRSLRGSRVTRLPSRRGASGRQPVRR